MGASSSKMDDDKALQLCRERKKFVKQALDGRCSLASAHFSYVQSLKSTGTALRKFIEPEAPIESSLYTSTNATLEHLDKTLSQFSLSSPSVTRHTDAAETFSPTPSPPSSSKFQANHMKFSGISSKKVEEKPPVAVIGTVTSSGTPHKAAPHPAEKSETSPFDDSSLPVETPPWDFFGLFHPIDHQFSFQEQKAMHQDPVGIVDDITRLKEEEGIPELELDEKVSSHGKEDSTASEDEFNDESDTDTLVQRFENFNRVNDPVKANDLHATNKPLKDDSTSEVEFVNGEKGNSPVVSPLKAASTQVFLPTETEKSMEEGNHSEKVVPKDFFSSMKDIELLFVKASESGKEVPRMLEANKLHFHPLFPAKEIRFGAPSCLKACFSCGDDPSQLPEEPAQNSVKYLTWHKTMSYRSSSSRNLLVANSKDDMEDLTTNLFDNFCMISGSHASTLDRLYAWERKLYDEVKIMSTAYNNSHAKIATHSELRRHITSYLENELYHLSSSFTKWIGAQKFYLEAINGWLHKCVSLKQKTARKRRPQRPLLRMYGPPIYATCEVWLEKLGDLHVQDVVDSMRSLAGKISLFLSCQEKNQGKAANHPHITSWNARESSDNLLRDASDNWDSGSDEFRASFLGFLGHLNNFARSSVMMYTDLGEAIQNAKKNYHWMSNSQAQDGSQWNSQSQVANSEKKSPKL